MEFNIYTRRILSQEKACLNSRPLHPLSNNPNLTILQVLTLGHFLTGESLTAVLEIDVTQMSTSRLRLVQ